MAEFDFDLGESVELLRRTVRTFARERIAPRAPAIDRDNRFPRDLWPQLGDLGLHGITVGTEDGGSGLGYLEQQKADYAVLDPSGEPLDTKIALMGRWYLGVLY